MPVSTPQRSRFLLFAGRRGLGLLDVLFIAAVVAVLVLLARREFPLYQQPPAPASTPAKPLNP